VHKNCRHQPGLERSDQHCHGDVRFLRAEMNVRQRDRDAGKYQQGGTDH
jgi:hypothetical protein